MRKHTTESFIDKAKQVHGDKYDYSLVEYTNGKYKVKIICPEHGMFEQTPYNHLVGQGCQECAGNKKYTTKSFIDKAKQVHGDKYDYSQVGYKTSHIKVKIICPEHGMFEQTPNSHLSGSGCRLCANNHLSSIKRSKKSYFIDKAKQVHGDKYDYSQVGYKRNNIKVKIICPEHGMFEQTPNSHLSGSGCFECTGRTRYTTESFIDKAKQVHGDKYDYSLVEYKRNNIKVKIICPEHGMFEQTPIGHLKSCGCFECTGRTRYTNSDIISFLTIEEDPKEENGVIYCRCTKCKEYFIPRKWSLYQRIYGLLGKTNRERRLYCSDECKNSCSIYNQSSYPKGYLSDTDTSRPDQPYLRELTLERDNYQCQICGSTKDLHCHHITGVEVNPIESADVDNCITLCYNCHKKIHSENGCSMKRERCK